MLQKQIPAWISHYLPDPGQAEDGRPLSTCALEVRKLSWVGGARSSVNSRDMGAPLWGSPHLAPGDVLWPSWLWSFTVAGPAVGAHKLDKMPWSGSGPCWGQASSQVDRAQHCEEWAHIWPILIVSKYLPCGHPKLSCCVSVWCDVW